MRNPAVKSPPIIEALRDATRTRHAQLGSSPAMSRLFAAQYTIAEYRSHLGRLLGFYEPLEHAVAFATDGMDSVRELARSSALREDLTRMGATTGDVEALARCRSLPSIEPGGLYGYAYVILGSMKGGKIINKRLRAILGPGASFHFYSDDQGRSEALWASFCVDLEAYGEEHAGKICATAVAIFDAYAAWISEPIPEPGNRRWNH